MGRKQAQRERYGIECEDLKTAEMKRDINAWLDEIKNVAYGMSAEFKEDSDRIHQLYFAVRQIEHIMRGEPLDDPESMPTDVGGDEI